MANRIDVCVISLGEVRKIHFSRVCHRRRMVALDVTKKNAIQTVVENQVAASNCGNDSKSGVCCSGL